MAWVIQFIVAVWLFRVAPFWLAAAIVLIMLWRYATRRQRHEDQRPQRAQRLSNGASAELVQLALLRQSLRRAWQEGQLDADEYGRLVRNLDVLDDRCCEALMIPESDRRQALEVAWQRLELHTGVPLMTPPWRTTTGVETDWPAEPNTAPATSIEPQVAARSENPQPLTPAGPAPEPTRPIRSAQPVGKKPDADLDTARQHAQQQFGRSEPAVSEQPSNPTPKPQTPSPLSRLNRRSRDFLSRFLLPFLWQNIGWFIGGFCFVSGSVFLVTYTTGFAKALVVVCTLTLYGLLLFWGGYRIRRKRPQLITAGQVLIALGMLVIPLVFAAATRLLTNGLAGPWLLLTALAAALAVLSLFAVAARLGSGMMDRSLLDQHSRLFIMLASMQFATPLLIVLPLWPTLALLHISLLGILVYAMRRFSRHWLHSIFIDQRKLAYYAAGTLVYAALVSFVHLTWGGGVALPAGYSGPFLMALCGVLLYADLHVKQWVEKRAWLSRFNFIIYALSAVALLSGVLPYQSFNAAFWPLVLMFTISSVLYALMVWHYLSLPPLYLLLGSFSAVYAMVVLRPFPEATHFILSLPGIYGLFLMRRLALRRKSAALAQVIHRLLLALIPALALWVLYHASPGWTAMLTPLTALLAAIVTLTNAPGQRPPEHRESFAIGNTGYLLTGLATLTLAYAPRLQAPWSLQFGITLLGLTGLWTLLAGSALRRATPRCKPVVLINSALLSLIAATGLAFTLGVIPFFIWMLAAAGGLLLWLSLIVRSRLLVYSTILTWSAAALLLIEHYHIATSGSNTLLVAIAIFVLLRWLECRRQGAVPTAGATAAAGDSWSLRLLWCWPLHADTYPSRTTMLVQPLHNACSLLWLIGLIKVGIGLVAGFSLLSSLEIRFAPAAGWTGAATLAALVTILQAGRTRLQVWLLPPAVLLLMSVMLAVVSAPGGWQPVLIALYAMLVWTLSAHCPAAPPRRLLNVLGWQSGHRAADGRRMTEHGLHWSAFTLVLGSVTLALHGSDAPLLATLAIGVAFLWLAGKRYRLQLHAYLVVAGISLGVLVLYRQLVDAALLHPPASHETALMQILLAIVLSGWAYRLSGTAAQAASPQTDSTPNACATNLYTLPLYHLGYLLYALALFITVPWALDTLGAVSPPAMDRMWQAGLLCLLAFALLPVLRPWTIPLPAMLSGYAPRIRGTMMPLLLSLAFFLLFPDAQGFGIIVWSFILWGAGALVLPRWNAWVAQPGTPESCRMPVDSPFCTRLGLVLILAGFTLHALQIPPDSPAAATLVSALPRLLAHTLAPLINVLFSLQQLSMPLLLGLTLYLTLLLRGRERNPPLFWAAGISITFSGLAGLLHIFPLTSGISKAFVLGALLWLNLLLRFGPLWHIYSPAGFRRFLPLARLSTPIRRIAAGLLLIFLLAVSVPTFSMLIHAIATDSTIPAPTLLTIALSALLTLSFAHRFRLKPCRLFAQILLFALFTSTVLILLSWADIALVLGLWTILLLLIPVALERGFSAKWRPLGTAAHAWLAYSFAVAFVTWIVQDTLPIMERLVTLALLSGVALTIGLRTLGTGHPNRGRLWLKGGVILSLLWLHWIGLPWLPVGAPVTVLLPWYALGMGGLAWLAYRFASERPERPSLAEKRALPASLSSALTWLLTWLAPLLFLLAVAEWLLHAWYYYQSLARPFAMQTPAGSLDHWAAILAGMLLTGLWLRQHHLSGNGLIVAIALTGAVLGIYIRLFLAGIAPLSVWDTAALLGAGFVLVILQHLWPPNKTVPAALNHLTLLMPFLALLTVPMQLSSTRASVSLLAVAALYLLMRQNRRHHLPVYLALLAFNLSIYLWIPELVVTTHLVQLYTIPAATTVLLMLHFHLLELKPSVSNAVRLTALSTLYASGSLDVFLRPDLSIFVLALALSLAGIILGIALRLRAFLYTGAAFLILNVAGQLVNYYPQQTLAKAIVLMALGGVITGGMIWFSIQREAILQRVRIIRADLAEWA